MTIDTCNPCCDPGPFANDNWSFKSAVLRILCELVAYKTVLCDGSGNPVLVRWQFVDGVPQTPTLYNLDGTEFSGDVGDIQFCGVAPS